MVIFGKRCVFNIFLPNEYGIIKNKQLWKMEMLTKDLRRPSTDLG